MRHAPEVLGSEAGDLERGGWRVVSRVGVVRGGGSPGGGGVAPARPQGGGGRLRVPGLLGVEVGVGHPRAGAGAPRRRLGQRRRRGDALVQNLAVHVAHRVVQRLKIANFMK